MLQLAPSLCEGQGTLCVLDNIGNFDEKVWRRRNPNEIASARSEFERLTTQGFVAFVVDDAGVSRGTIQKFDPSVSKIIMSPPSVGVSK